MIGPVASDLAELGFVAAGTKAESHSGSGPFERPTANPPTPAARMADTIRKAVTARFIANLLPDVPSRRISPAAPPSASAGRVELREAVALIQKLKKDRTSRTGRRFARCRPTNGPVAVGAMRRSARPSARHRRRTRRPQFVRRSEAAAPRCEPAQHQAAHLPHVARHL